MFGWRVPAPNQALLISGGKQRASDGSAPLNFRIVVGHGAFVLPIFRKASFLSLAMRRAWSATTRHDAGPHAERSRRSSPSRSATTCQSIAAASRRFLADQQQMSS